MDGIMGTLFVDLPNPRSVSTCNCLEEAPPMTLHFNALRTGRRVTTASPHCAKCSLRYTSIVKLR